MFFDKKTMAGRDFTSWASFTNEKLIEAEYKVAAHNLTLAQYDQVTQVLEDYPDVKKDSKDSLKYAKWSFLIAGAIFLFEVVKYLYSFSSN